MRGEKYLNVDYLIVSLFQEFFSYYKFVLSICKVWFHDSFFIRKIEKTFSAI